MLSKRLKETYGICSNYLLNFWDNEITSFSDKLILYINIKNI